jgi:hypothetical protein
MSRSGFRFGRGPAGRAARRCGAAVGALLLGLGPAAADLTAPDLWAEWQETALGGSFTAAGESYADGVLSLTGVAYSSAAPGGEGRMTLGDLTLRELDDGTVSVEIPAVMEMTSQATVEGPDGPRTVEMQVEVTQNGFAMTVAEAGEDGLRYVYEATSILTNIESPGEAAGEVGTVSVAARGLSGETVVRDGRFEQSQAAESLTIQSAATREGADDGEPGTVTARYQMTDMTGEAQGTLPAAPPGGAATLAEMGLDVTGALRHAGSLIEVDADGAQPFTLQGGSAAGAVEFAATPESLTYAVSSETTAMELTSAALPFAVPFELASSRIEMQLPVGSGSDAGAAPFGAALALRELSLGEAVWGLFDPSGQIPREPLTVVLDLDGMAEMNADLFGDPAAMADLQGPPGVPRTLNLTELLVRFGGAELRGEGAVEFDEAMAAVGTVELALDGGMALMDRLVTLGVLPQEQAMGLRAMLGVVARPVGEDNLVSTIELTEGGGVLANGMQIR